MSPLKILLPSRHLTRMTNQTNPRSFCKAATSIGISSKSKSGPPSRGGPIRSLQPKVHFYCPLTKALLPNRENQAGSGDSLYSDNASTDASATNPTQSLRISSRFWSCMGASLERILSTRMMKMSPQLTTRNLDRARLDLFWAEGRARNGSNERAMLALLRHSSHCSRLLWELE